MKRKILFFANILYFCLSCSHTQDPLEGIPLDISRVEDHQYLRDTYFFLDTIYRENYKNFGTNFNHVAIDLPNQIIPDSFEVYKAAPGYEMQFPDKSFQAWAIYDYPGSDGVLDNNDFGMIIAGEVTFGYFIRLAKDEYLLEPQLGYIRVNSPLSVKEILAVSYTTLSGIRFGDFVNQELVLKLIKPAAPRSAGKTWALAWKHVYSLGKDNIELEGFDVKIFFKASSGSPRDVDDNGVKWITRFGLDRMNKNGDYGTPDGIIDIDPNINIVNLFLGELHFPDLKPFDPEGFWVNNEFIQLMSDNDFRRISAIYDTTSQSFIKASSKFYIEITSKQNSSN